MRTLLPLQVRQPGKMPANSTWQKPTKTHRKLAKISDKSNTPAEFRFLPKQARKKETLGDVHVFEDE